MRDHIKNDDVIEILTWLFEGPPKPQADRQFPEAQLTGQEVNGSLRVHIHMMLLILINHRMKIGMINS